MSETLEPLKLRGLIDEPIEFTLDHWVFVFIVAGMAWNIIMPTVAPTLQVIAIGPINLYVNDIMIIVAMAMSASAVLEAIFGSAVTPYRLVVITVVAYLIFQVMVILPVAVARTGAPIIGVMRVLSPRFVVVYLLYFYLRGLRVISVRFVVTTLNIAALCLVVFAAGRYAILGPVGYFAGTEDRLREVDGGAALFFGWLVLTRFYMYRPSFTNWVMILAGGVGFILVNYRMAYLGLALAFFIMLIGTGRALGRLTMALLMLAVVVIAVAIGPPTIRENAVYSITRVVDPSTPTSIDRLERYQAGLDYFKVHPLGDYAITGRNYLVSFGHTEEQNHEPHNFVVQILSQQGMLAMAFYAFIIVVALVVGWWNRLHDMPSGVAFGYLVFYLTFCSFTTSFFGVANAPFFGLAIGMILWRDVQLSTGAVLPDVSDA